MIPLRVAHKLVDPAEHPTSIPQMHSESSGDVAQQYNQPVILLVADLSYEA